MELSVKRGRITVTSQDSDVWNLKSEEKGMKQGLRAGFCNLLKKFPLESHCPTRGGSSWLTSSRRLTGGRKTETNFKGLSYLAPNRWIRGEYLIVFKYMKCD